MYCFEKINKNPYKYSNLTNLNIKFYHLNYFAVPKKEDNILRSDSNHIPNRYAIVENRFSVPIGWGRHKGGTECAPLWTEVTIPIGFEPRSKSLRDYGEPFLCTDWGARHKVGAPSVPPFCVWPTRSDSNRWPSESESDALSSWATGRFWFALVLYHIFAWL